MKVGLFFGSFNPIHMGHLIIAQAALNETDLHRIWMVVSPQNPLKAKKNLLSEYHRLRMVELALGGHPEIHASNVEFLLPKPSYTIDTLLHLDEKYPSYDFSIIMGEDNLKHIHRWKNFEALLRHYPVHVYPRLGYEGNHFERYPQVSRFEMPLLDISATRMRNMLKEGKSIRYLTPDNVFHYIEENTLYGDQGAYS